MGKALAVYLSCPPDLPHWPQYWRDCLSRMREIRLVPTVDQADVCWTLCNAGLDVPGDWYRAVTLGLYTVASGGNADDAERTSAARFRTFSDTIAFIHITELAEEKCK